MVIDIIFTDIDHVISSCETPIADAPSNYDVVCIGSCLASFQRKLHSTSIGHLEVFTDSCVI